MASSDRVQFITIMMSMSKRAILLGIAMLWAGVPGSYAWAAAQDLSPVSAQQVPTTSLSGRVEVAGAAVSAKMHHTVIPKTVIPETVVWLTPITPTPIPATGGDAATVVPSSPPSSANLQLVQITRVSSRTSSWFPRVRWWSFPIAILFS